MKKLTPKDTFGALVTSTGNFRDGKTTQVLGDQAERNAVKDYYKGMSVPKLDVSTFGKYFIRCCQLNSILKKGQVVTTTLPHNNQFQVVMKSRIGCRSVKTGGVPYGNARYATDDQIFGFLRKEHKELLCKKDRQDILQDFLNLKDDTIAKVERLKRDAVHMISDDVQVSEVYEIKYGNPEVYEIKYDNPECRGYNLTGIGFVQMNHRNLSHEELWVDITSPNFNINTEFDTPKKAFVVDSYTKRRNNIDNLSITVGFTETQLVKDVDDEGNPIDIPKHANYSLVGSNINPSSPYDHYSFSVYNHDFTGIDFIEIQKRVVEDYKVISDWFDAELIRLRNKYSAEYTMWELVYGTDCAI